MARARAAVVGGRAGGGTGWRERRRGGTLLRAAPTGRGDGLGGWGGRGEAGRDAEEPTLPRYLPPPEASRSPSSSRASVSPLSKCWHQLTCLSRGKGIHMSKLWKLKRRSLPREWLFFMIKTGEGEALAISALPLVGKGGDPEARARIGNPH